jgi:hypothetical protein
MPVLPKRVHLPAVSYLSGSQVSFGCFKRNRPKKQMNTQNLPLSAVTFRSCSSGVAEYEKPTNIGKLREAHHS